MQPRKQPSKLEQVASTATVCALCVGFAWWLVDRGHAEPWAAALMAFALGTAAILATNLLRRRG